MITVKGTEYRYTLSPETHYYRAEQKKADPKMFIWHVAPLVWVSKT